MSFDWSKYLVVAEHLYNNANKEEAFLRSAISRAYYAAFVSARNLLRDKDGLEIPKADVHNFVITKFLTSRNPMRQKIGSNLFDLRKIRNLADYRDDVTTQQG
jgi:uncharacterized protein (UPF0332 family)